MIRLLLVDDHPVVSSGLAARYAASREFEVAGISRTLAEAVHHATHHPVDVSILDIQLETLVTPRQVSALAERCRVVLFSARGGDPYVDQLVAAGASAAVDKAASLDELDEVIRAVQAGRAPPSTRLAAPTGSRSVLSAREYEVYRALARCQTPKEVAASLGIARSTVYCHIENLRRKLGVQTLQEIVARASAEP